jgi:hypothetical protein
MPPKLSFEDLDHQDVPGSLQLISDDIEAHPYQLQPLDAGLVQLVHELVQDVEIDLNASLSVLDE